jgi:UDPglucose 6-dehydrogenase
MSMKIGFYGLTHLGLIYSIVSAEKGFSVNAVDDDHLKIQDIKNKNINFYEKKFHYYLNKNIGSKIFFYNEIKYFKDCKLIFISEDIPTDIKGKSNYKPLKNKINIIKKNFPKSILIILSQLEPGFLKSITWEKNKLFYQVETLIFGEAIKRASNPERLIIGTKDKKIKLPKAYLIYLNSFNSKIFKISYESAELAKISINMLLISNLSISNYLSNISNLIGASWRDIMPILKSDRRIGQFSYLLPGLGLSGGNLERDLYTLKKTSRKKNFQLSLLESYVEIFSFQKKWLIKKIDKIKPKTDSLISIFGLTYKEGTNSIKNSPSVDFINYLLSKKFKIYTYDKRVNLDTHFNDKNVVQLNDIHEVYKKSNIIAIFHSSELLKNKYFIRYLNNKNNVYILDPFGLLFNHLKNNKNYFCL